MAGRVSIATALLASTLTFGCSKGSSPPTTAVDTTAIRSSVDSMMRGHFAAFERGDLAGWTGIMADDVFLTAADPAEVFDSRDAALAEMKRDFTPAFQAGLKLSVRPRASFVWVENNGRTATATFDLDYTVSIANQTHPYRLRASYLLAGDTTGWQVLASQYSRPVSYDSLFMALAQRRIPTPAAGTGAVLPSAGEIAEQFRRDIKDISKANFASNAVVITPGSIVQGAEAASRELGQWMGPAGNVIEPRNELRSQLTPSGTAGYVGTNLLIPVFAGPESLPAPMRALFVYRLGNNRWEIVQASLSVGLTDPS